ncbi:nicotinamide N-methyltransferase, putative [Ixodes scapularis]|uniref:Nicotinamide N-methyltransferase, putative n=1 Tax=Ixodes scapularis TaxID=6945 RepID=B7Q2U6_IXOSC|nr:nicotinamide N-methyltransferase, putative [Ixodes scapularis]|eukprot:XP_002411036.1 nicotinamide N-methyltransferase, putative [Ixodes scapularis]
MVSSIIALRGVLNATTAALRLGSRHLKDVSYKTRSYSSDALGSMETQALRDVYKNKFLPRTYMDTYGRPFGIIDNFHIEELHRIFQTARGETLLDLGSGPMILNALLASSRFKHIVLSDLVEDNRLELNKWLKKDEDAIDWTFRAEMIANFEGYSDIKKGALEILERTRSAIRKVVPCDVLEPGVLPEEHRETFDAIISSGCLESATADHESFRKVVCNVGTLAKPGGLLILVGEGCVKSYPVGTVDFVHANITEDVLKQAVTEAGFEMKVFLSKKIPMFIQNIDEFFFVLAARKV